MTFRAVRIVLEKLAVGAGMKQCRGREMVDEDLDVGVDEMTTCCSAKAQRTVDICSGWSNRRSSVLARGLFGLIGVACRR